MTGSRIHITGASGAGVTTLGRALADRLAIPHHDTDDYYWRPTDPPYRAKRPVADRLRLMDEMFLPRPAWVLSGSLDGWGDPVIPRFTLAVFVRTDTAVRIARLRAREVRRYGGESVSPGGGLADDTRAFLDWASQYDDGGYEIRSLTRHEAWLDTLSCPVLRLDGGRPTADLVDAVIAAPDGRPPG